MAPLSDEYCIKKKKKRKTGQNGLFNNGTIEYITITFSRSIASTLLSIPLSIPLCERAL